MQKPYKRDCYHRFDLREISCGVILVTNHLSVGIGIARYTVESIVCSRNSAVAVGDCQYVARCIVVEGLGRYNRIVTELLDGSRSYSAETIISVTPFGRICKYFA